jgi:predicted MFS family arabinose efflux permease
MTRASDETHPEPVRRRRPHSADGAPRRVSAGAGFWLVAVGFAVSMAFTTLPTPLWPLYQRSDGLSTTSVTVAFSAYAVGVLVSLFLGGHLSDWMGRRTIMFPAVLAEVVSAVIFVSWHALPGLLLARFVSGLGIGLITATATAYLIDLRGRARPDDGPRTADQVATAANLGGLGVGPIIAGLTARYLPGPLTTAYVIFGLLLVLVILMIFTVPETVERRHRSYRPQRVSVPADARTRYLLLGVAGFIAFALFGLFSSLAPKILDASLGIGSTVITGLVSGLVFLLAVVAQLVFGGVSTGRQVGWGLAALGAGFVLLLISGLSGTTVPFLTGAVFGGVGAGLAFKGVIASAREMAAAEVRSEAIAGMFLAAYLGLVIPVVGLGLASHLVSLDSGLVGFSAIALLLLALTGFGLSRHRQRA